MGWWANKLDSSLGINTKDAFLTQIYIYRIFIQMAEANKRTLVYSECP